MPERRRWIRRAGRTSRRSPSLPFAASDIFVVKSCGIGELVGTDADEILGILESLKSVICDSACLSCRGLLGDVHQLLRCLMTMATTEVIPAGGRGGGSRILPRPPVNLEIPSGSPSLSATVSSTSPRSHAPAAEPVEPDTSSKAPSMSSMAVCVRPIP